MADHHDPSEFTCSATLVLGLTPQGDFVQQIYLDPHPDDMPGEAPVPVTHNVLVKVVTLLRQELLKHADYKDQRDVLPKCRIEYFEDSDKHPWVRVKLGEAGEYLDFPRAAESQLKEPADEGS